MLRDEFIYDEPDAVEQRRELLAEMEEYDQWWTNKDGRMVLIAAMDSKYLINTIRFLNRAAEKRDIIPARLDDRYVNLCAEAVRRGIEDRIKVQTNAVIDKEWF